MQLIQYPAIEDAERLMARPAGDLSPYRDKVAGILAEIRREGDVAVRRFARQFDGQEPERIPQQAFESAETALPQALRTAIRQAYGNIKKFHAAQQFEERLVETMPGVRCWRRSVPVERVGLYIPGGTAPLFSTVLMLGVPAQLAGCGEVVLCTPPQPGGGVHPAVLYAAMLCGIRQVFQLGGVQAIGAMAYGTETVPRVWKIFGPGNAWVTAAKQLVSLDGVAVDLPAGPSEVAVVADAGANPRFVAADLLSQAEHGPDSQVLLISDSAGLLDAVQSELNVQLATLPRRIVAAQALASSKALLVPSLGEAMDWVNAYAPEHLILQVTEPERLALQVRNAGSVFLGPWTPESAGDYASGTNHTLPTGGAARAYSGVSLDSFFKKITFQEITPSGLARLGPVIVEMARAEGLEGHAQAVHIRQADSAGIDDSAPAPRSIANLVRPEILALNAYASARDEFDDFAGQVELPDNGSTPSRLIFLDANENSLGGPLEQDFSRYPAPRQGALKAMLAEREGLQLNQVFLGNGSDEAIDLILRAFCVPGQDNVLLLPPTYGMYAVQANIQGVSIREAPLRPDFSPDPLAIRAATDANSKVLFLCSPNNPSGNCLPEAFVRDMLLTFPGIVVVDEAYVDFSAQISLTRYLDEFPNLVVLKTFSKAWGLAGLRFGMAFAGEPIIQVLNKIKYPYNLNTATLQMAFSALQNVKQVEQNIQMLLAERERMAIALARLPVIREVFPSEANFLLVRTVDAGVLYDDLFKQGIVVRNRSRELHCENCLRITIGTPAENDRLLAALRNL